ncbi:MAG: prolipoprotein diacylglyceryl transferase [Polyangiales bacterium]
MPLPYIQIPDGHIPLPFRVHIPFMGIDRHDLPIHPFGVLVATGVLIGSSLTVRRAVQRGLDRAKMESFISWILGFGFVLSHVLDELMYRPRDVLKDPLVLLKIWVGISSFGGFIGGSIGAYLWSRENKERILPYLENVAAIFPISWIFGRAGCSVAHDHIGMKSTAWFAVNFPAYMGGPRLDLGLLELSFTIPIAIFIYWYARKPRPEGSIVAILCLIYAPIRYLLDSMRAVDIHDPDARYAGLTPGMWLSIGLIVVGLALATHSRRKSSQPPAAAA